MAIKNRQPAAGGIAHADHGVQFTSWAFTNKIRASGLMPSFGIIVDCYDNSIDKNPSGRACRSSCIGRIAGQGSNWRTRYSLFSRSSTTVNAATHNSDTRILDTNRARATRQPNIHPCLIFTPREVTKLLGTSKWQLKLQQSPSSLHDQVAVAGRSVLEDAREAHGERNVLVHEQWTDDENGRWVRGHNPLKDRHPAWTMPQFDNVLRKLTRVSERMYSLLSVVRAHRQDTLDQIYEFDLAVIEDRFTMDDDGNLIAG